MIGISHFLSAVDKTQRTKASLVKVPECQAADDRDDDETVLSISSPDQAPRTKTCACSKMSGTVNSLQADYIKRRWLEIKDNDILPETIEPPRIDLTKPPKLSDYLLKPTFVFHPERQYGLSFGNAACPFCSAVGTLRFKEMGRPRHIHTFDSDAYYIR